MSDAAKIRYLMRLAQELQRRGIYIDSALYFAILRHYIIYEMLYIESVYHLSEWQDVCDLSPQLSIFPV